VVKVQGFIEGSSLSAVRFFFVWLDDKGHFSRVAMKTVRSEPFASSVVSDTHLPRGGLLLIECYMCAYVCSREIDEGDRLTPQHMRTEAQELLWCEIDKSHEAIAPPSSLPQVSCVVAASRQATFVVQQTSPLGEWRMGIPLDNTFCLCKETST
jgi:hypothetical protein